MKKQALHDMLPCATHDEAARQEFVVALRREVVFEARRRARNLSLRAQGGRF